MSDNSGKQSNPKGHSTTVILNKQAIKPEDRIKQLETENRTLRFKFKSVESQASKNEAEVATKLAKYQKD